MHIWIGNCASILSLYVSRWIFQCQLPTFRNFLLSESIPLIILFTAHILHLTIYTTVHIQKARQNCPARSACLNWVYTLSDNSIFQCVLSTKIKCVFVQAVANAWTNYMWYLNTRYLNIYCILHMLSLLLIWQLWHVSKMRCHFKNKKIESWG